MICGSCLWILNTYSNLEFVFLMPVSFSFNSFFLYLLYFIDFYTIKKYEMGPFYNKPFYLHRNKFFRSVLTVNKTLYTINVTYKTLETGKQVIKLRNKGVNRLTSYCGHV